MARRRGGRKRSNRSAELIEFGAGAGVVLGLLHAAASAKHAKPAPGCAHPSNAGSCLGHAVNATIGPYIADAVAGACVGAVVALCVLLLYKSSTEALRPRRAPRLARSPPTSFGSRVDPPVPSAVDANATPGVAAVDPSLPIELTRDELAALRAEAREAVLTALRNLGGSGTRSTIIDGAKTAGQFTEHQLQAPPPPGDRGRYPLLIDRELSWTLTELKRGGLLENPHRGIWRLTPEASALREAAFNEAPTGSRLSELRTMPYREYLQTPEWQKTRAAALMRAGHRCSLDSTHRSDLDVHHNTYERLGAELAGDLVVLCRDCHRRHHTAPPPKRDR